MQADDPQPTSLPVKVPTLRQMKIDGKRIVASTAYDATFGSLLDRCGVDVILVGDSLGMVVLGDRNTLSVSMDAMVHHTRAAARNVHRALVVADMPFASYPDPATAFANAARLIAEGRASMVKLEGDGHVLDSLRYLSEREIPVCAHLGLTPQSVHRFGGFRLQGKSDEAAAKIRNAALACEQAGAEMLVLECVPSALAAEVTASVKIPVIGIGAGLACDGQILVSYDLLGLGTSRRPRFVKNFLTGRDSADAAVKAYVEEVRMGLFPDADHSY
jgi:3-methyl-2-oxobutanoate hydroxymethyltransferase